MCSVFDAFPDTYDQRCFLVTVHPLSFKIEPYTCFSSLDRNQAKSYAVFTKLSFSFALSYRRPVSMSQACLNTVI